MREATYWDLLNLYHFIIIAVFLIIFGIEIKFLKKPFSKNKFLLKGISLSIFLFTIFVAFVVRNFAFPGGSLNDTAYNADRFRIMRIQEHLEAHKKACKSYPSTEQGLTRLSCDLKKVGCPDYVPMGGFTDDIKYKSDGQTYELETTRPYKVRNLVVKANNGDRPRLYVRTIEEN